MMLLEDLGKRLFRERGIRVPAGRTVTSPGDLAGTSAPAVIKALVPVGGRGKAGGVVVTRADDEVPAAVERVLGMTISGHLVRSVLVEEALPIAREVYLSIVIDRSAGVPALIAAAPGGVDVESLPPASVRRWPVHPFVCVPRYAAWGAARFLELPGREAEVGELLRRMWELFVSLDCELVEINPLVLTTDGTMVAADAKLVVNDDSLFRHPELPAPTEEGEGTEGEARREGIAFVRLDGDIGVIANGAGLTMATLDAIFDRGGRPGGFMDLGGTDDPARVRRAFEIMAGSGQKVVLVNIFGGMTRCDTVAQGMLDALGSMPTRPATVARIRGVNEALAREMLLSAGLAARTDLEEAVRDAVEASWA
ncbi:MAG: acetate--CoA ligase family protein [Methanomassiliicoccus sp.]|nr:acetate--CoA ligase family protein [Methanomassiliicoccus sp.]